MFSTSPQRRDIGSSAPIVASATDGSATTLFTAHSDSSVRQWRADGTTTWIEIRQVRTSHAAKTLVSLAVAPSPALPPGTFATGGSDGVAQVHDAMLAPNDPITHILPGPSRVDVRVLALAFAPADPLLAVLYPHEVRLFARGSLPKVTWRLQRTIPLPATAGAALSFAPGGKYLIAAGIVLARDSAASWAWKQVAALPGVMDEDDYGQGDVNDSSIVPNGHEQDEHIEESKGSLVSAHWAATGFLAVSRQLSSSAERVTMFGSSTEQSEKGVVQVYRLWNGKFTCVANIKTDTVVCALEWDRTGTVFAGVAEGMLYKFGRTLRDGQWVWDVRDKTSLLEGVA